MKKRNVCIFLLLLIFIIILVYVFHTEYIKKSFISDDTELNLTYWDYKSNEYLVFKINNRNLEIYFVETEKNMYPLSTDIYDTPNTFGSVFDYERLKRVKKESSIYLDESEYKYLIELKNRCINSKGFSLDNLNPSDGREQKILLYSGNKLHVAEMYNSVGNMTYLQILRINLLKYCSEFPPYWRDCLNEDLQYLKALEYGTGLTENNADTLYEVENVLSRFSSIDIVYQEEYDYISSRDELTDDENRLIKNAMKELKLSKISKLFEKKFNLCCIAYKFKVDEIDTKDVDIFSLNHYLPESDIPTSNTNGISLYVCDRFYVS